MTVGAPERGGEPLAEPLTLGRDGPGAEQAVFDAEFVAIVIAEQPWGESEPSPRRTPPTRATRTRRGPSTPGRSPRRGPRDRRPPALGEVRRDRRRLCPGPRSPPPGRTTASTP
jgi:hypothetical protein